MTKLIGDTIFVTGGAQGVGEGVARRLVQDGARRVALVDRNGEVLHRTAESLRGLGAEVHPIQADLSDVVAAKGAVTGALERFGKIDIMCNCAGVTLRGGILDTTPETFDQIFAVNVRANFFMMQTALPSMIERGGGVIVNMSSMLAHGGMTHLLPYSASKATLNLLTRNIAHSMRTHRIRVHAINLGWTVTPSERRVQTELHGAPEDWDRIEGEKQPFGRLVLPEDIGGVCSFLASDQATMMTGNMIDLEQWVSGVIEV